MGGAGKEKARLREGNRACVVRGTQFLALSFELFKALFTSCLFHRVTPLHRGFGV
ncbi:MAG: hypothetical protein IT525_06570 [Nitrosomonas sp.]|nr:hypothetical protein [Nitrosomonas sp.]